MDTTDVRNMVAVSALSPTASSTRGYHRHAEAEQRRPCKGLMVRL